MIGRWVSTPAFIGKTISAISGLLMKTQHLITYTLSKRKLRSIDEPSEVMARYAGRVDDKNRAVIIKDAWRSKDRSPEWELLKSKRLGRRWTDVGLGRKWTDDVEAERL
jgi:hypothetical protein